MSSSSSQHRTLRIGNVSCLFADGDLRYITVAGREAVRRIYMPVRDASWGTITPVISGLGIDDSAGGFRVEYDALHERDGISFAWHATITGRATGERIEISFAMDGQARTTFRTCRTGFCVLHPIQGCAGQPVEVEHDGGQVVHTRFPGLISPHQPFSDIRAMTHEVWPGVRTTVRFDGDVFETEDQRNWTDTSFKTYCRPLRLPFPYELAAGQRVRQSVTITIVGQPTSAVADDEAIEVRGEVIGKLPSLGLQLGNGRGPRLSPEQRERVRALRLPHVRADVQLARAALEADVRAIATEAAALDLPLELGVHVQEDAEREFKRLTQALEAVRPRIVRAVVYRMRKQVTPASDVAIAKRHLHRYDPSTAVGGGTIGNFTELNRNRPAAGSMDALAYPVNPQIHAVDDLSLVENLAAQADTVAAAKSFAGGAHIAVGPVLLSRRPDPFAAGKSGATEAAAGDPRQKLPIGAAWTLGSIKYLAEAGADSITYYDVAGPLGVMDDNDGSPYPMYEVFRMFAELGGADVLRVTAPQPLRAVALAVRRRDKTSILVANLLAAPNEVLVRSGGQSHARTLPPYGVAVID